MKRASLKVSNEAEVEFSIAGRNWVSTFPPGKGQPPELTQPGLLYAQKWYHQAITLEKTEYRAVKR